MDLDAELDAMLDTWDPRQYEDRTFLGTPEIEVEVTAETTQRLWGMEAYDDFVRRYGH